MDKINLIKRISDDVEYLKVEYDCVKIWGSNPNGDVGFNKLMAWLSDGDNIEIIENMIKVSKDIKQLSP